MILVHVNDRKRFSFKLLHIRGNVEGRKLCVKALMEAGADADIKDFRQKKAWQYSQSDEVRAVSLCTRCPHVRGTCTIAPIVRLCGFDEHAACMP
jgi:hypothetical protein